MTNYNPVRIPNQPQRRDSFWRLTPPLRTQLVEVKGKKKYNVNTQPQTLTFLLPYLYSTTWVLHATLVTPITRRQCAPRYSVPPLRSQSNTGHLIACSMGYLCILPSHQSVETAVTPAAHHLHITTGCQPVYGIILGSIKDHSTRLPPQSTNTHHCGEYVATNTSPPP